MRRDVFQAIADPVRRNIIELIAEEELTVNAVAERFEISRPAISRHIKILEECGLLVINRRGRERYCRLDPKGLLPAFLWMEKYQQLWEDRLDSFANYLKQYQRKNT